MTREEELENAVLFLSTMLGVYSYLLMDVSKKLEELGGSFALWQNAVVEVQNKFGLDIEKVVELLQKKGYSDPNRKEYLN